MKNYIAIVLTLFTLGCADAEPEYVSGWPRMVVVENALITDRDLLEYDYVQRGIDEINRRVGSVVFVLAVASSVDAGGPDALPLTFVDAIYDAKGAVSTRIGSWDRVSHRDYVRIKKTEHGDENVVAHELIHSILGSKHDTDSASTFFAHWRCLYLTGLPESEQRPVAECEDGYASITPQLVARIQKKIAQPRLLLSDYASED